MALTDTKSEETQNQPFDFTFESSAANPKVDVFAFITQRAAALERRRAPQLKSEHKDMQNRLTEAQINLEAARQANALSEAEHLSEIRILKGELHRARHESEGRRLEMWALGYRNRLLLKEMAVQKEAMSARLSEEAMHSFQRNIKHFDQRARVSSAHEELERAEAEIRRLVKELLVSGEQSTELQDRTVPANTPDPAVIKHSNGCAAPAAVGVVDKCSTPQRFIRDLRISVDRYMRFPKVSIVMDDVGPGKLPFNCFPVAVQDAVELQRVLPDVIRAARLVAEEMADL